VDDEERIAEKSGRADKNAFVIRYPSSVPPELDFCRF
jgi:hypothetical protein